MILDMTQMQMSGKHKDFIFVLSHIAAVYGTVTEDFWGLIVSWFLTVQAAP